MCIGNKQVLSVISVCADIPFKKFRRMYWTGLWPILPTLMIVFFTKLMLKFFILIYLLHSSICFGHYCVHLQEDNYINTASGIVTLETSEWSKLLKYIVCCIIWTLEDGKIHIKSIQNPVDIIKKCKCWFAMCGLRHVDEMFTLMTVFF